MPKIQLPSGLSVHYQRVGRGPDLVMLHGLTGNLAVWHFKIIPLLMNRFRILTYDLRGHGFTSMPPTGYSATSLAGDLRDLLDALDIGRASVVGHSYGGDVALYFALLHPDRVRRVVAIEATLPALAPSRGDETWEGWSYWAEVLEKSGHPVPPEHRQDVDYLTRLSLKVPKKWGPLNGLPRNPEPFLRLLDTTTLVREFGEVGDLTVENLPNLRAAVHLVYGEKSAFLSTCETLAAHLPNVTSTLLPRTEWGHFGPLEQPERVAELLLESLDAPGDGEPEPQGAPGPPEVSLT
jgi:pimeloyl-ACP methyl ester carboxylesterase